MSGITVLSPVGINRVEAQPIAPRLKSLEGVKIGILNNSKPNSLPLQERIVELLSKQYKFGGVVKKQKPNASVGAEKLDVYAREVGAVITAMGD
ncbi:MAG: hypothetical protein HY423_14835 [Candidatus Lambdaproteobacteria bacterium]|nr:hypothetical protein [Candidatus Lambdaproteobacteria bacterium]